MLARVSSYIPVNRNALCIQTYSIEKTTPIPILYTIMYILLCAVSKSVNARLADKCDYAFDAPACVHALQQPHTSPPHPLMRHICTRDASAGGVRTGYTF